MDLHTLAWIGFFIIIVLLLAMDLGVFHRRAHVIKMKEAARWTVFWIAVGLTFTVVVYFVYMMEGKQPAEAAQTYLTGYVLEKMLSVDNLFVFVILLRFFGVKSRDQHHVLFWGILGALVMRGIFIFAGTAAIQAYEPTLYFFGGLLMYTAVRMAVMGEHEFDPAKSRIYLALKKVLPLSHAPHHGHFFTREHAKLLGTSLLLCLVMVEMTDVLFALDSVPAVLGITSDTFIVYTSNVFAILGLRALYFVIAGGLASLKYLKPALVIVLAFISIKMLISGPWWHLYDIPVTLSLLIVVVILATAIIASRISTRMEREKQHGARHDRAGPGDGKRHP